MSEKVEVQKNTHKHTNRTVSITSRSLITEAPIKNALGHCFSDFNVPMNHQGCFEWLYSRIEMNILFSFFYILLFFSSLWDITFALISPSLNPVSKENIGI